MSERKEEYKYETSAMTLIAITPPQIMASGNIAEAIGVLCSELKIVSEVAQKIVGTAIVPQLEPWKCGKINNEQFEEAVYKAAKDDLPSECDQTQFVAAFQKAWEKTWPVKAEEQKRLQVLLKEVVAKKGRAELAFYSYTCPWDTGWGHKSKPGNRNAVQITYDVLCIIVCPDNVDVVEEKDGVLKMRVKKEGGELFTALSWHRSHKLNRKKASILKGLANPGGETNSYIVVFDQRRLSPVGEKAANADNQACFKFMQACPRDQLISFDKLRMFISPESFRPSPKPESFSRLGAALSWAGWFFTCGGCCGCCCRRTVSEKPLKSKMS